MVKEATLHGPAQSWPKLLFSLAVLNLSAFSSPPVLTVHLSHNFLSFPSVCHSGSEKQDFHPSTAWSPTIRSCAWKSQRILGSPSSTQASSIWGEAQGFPGTDGRGCFLPSAVGSTGVGVSVGPAQLELALATPAGPLLQVHHHYPWGHLFLQR